MDRKGLALDGYDPVSYFQKEGPKEGLEDFEVREGYLRYLFVSESNRDLFIANPEAYRPAYGGWCAYAMGVNGDKVKIDPETFTILDGKLYLFYNFRGNNTLTTWKEDEVRLQVEANKYWSEIISAK
ncbi:MAG: YHS domain protein [Cyclobacteriaceae bacterium]|nr:YHS domain protein [Cyclobacteriaceae bacterium HetDA_MAG_MS6]